MIFFLLSFILLPLSFLSAAEPPAKQMAIPEGNHGKVESGFYDVTGKTRVNVSIDRQGFNNPKAQVFLYLVNEKGETICGTTANAAKIAAPYTTLFCSFNTKGLVQATSVKISATATLDTGKGHESPDKELPANLFFSVLIEIP